MEIKVLRPKKLNEKELKQVITEYPDLLLKGVKAIGEEVTIDGGKARVDLVLSQGNKLIVAEVKADPNTYYSLYQSAFYYNTVQKEFDELKAKLNQPRLKDLEIFLIQPSYPEWMLELANLFKEELPLRLFTFKAYETGENTISVVFREVDFRKASNEEGSSNISSPEQKSTGVSDPLSYLQVEELKPVAKDFLKDIQSIGKDEIVIEEKDWGYSVKKGRKAIFHLSARKAYLRVDALQPDGEWVKASLDKESYDHYLDLFKKTLEELSKNGKKELANV